MKTALLWYPSAAISVFDVAAGLQTGLQANGVKVIPFHLTQHVPEAAAMLEAAYEAKRKENPTIEKFTQADVYYKANMPVLERALRYDCEWVFMVSALGQHPDYAVMLRRSGRKVALLCTESPYQTDQELRYAKYVDHVFVNERSVVDQFRAVNPNVSYLGAAWHPLVHTMEARSADSDCAMHDVVFVGTGFIERIQLLEQMDWAGINFGLYGTWELMAETKSTARKYLPKHKRKPMYTSALPNTSTAALYRNAKVGLNLHRTSVEYEVEADHVSGAESLNPRCYELAACGRFFISDYRAEGRDVFGDALPTFTTSGEATYLVRKALQEPQWRQDVAGKVKERIQPHSWVQRAAQALEALDRPAVARVA
jgi:spore maturation protein CgeB